MQATQVCFPPQGDRTTVSNDSVLLETWRLEVEYTKTLTLSRAC
jgi:hypothetical protein